MMLRRVIGFVIVRSHHLLLFSTVRRATDAETNMPLFAKGPISLACDLPP